GNVTSGLQKYGDTVDGKEVPGSTKANNGLVDLSKPANGDAPKVSDNTAATVGDLRNMGWIVSSDKTTGANGTTTDTEYSEAVKNANEVRFVGEGSAIVSGKTEGNIRTITVKVDNQTGINKTVTPVNYTKADGTKVYPKTVTDPKTGKEEVKFFENPDGSGAVVSKGDVVTSINGPEGTTSPTTLKNVKN
ncbi:Hia/Hsf adhesin N-terminal domain-containing protein, partial [Veillonella sp. 3627]|uniref:Hia/Hsf adhesin N-terminal domain-containing protein n=1 Tax=Veillonella sp. 3627 TaxID=2490953 RepID=UPI00197D1A97